ncbi:MAG: hypothetical protein L0332_05290 [Chloroflexi bacterium]|nr:hypothetical protein [Chloroflexota bacterium]MCI0579944.1 hypothetical protein [Chloroflexota bacterium]MCI0646527.1 hypothetical protein [Chloroflexota bacterium]MCI0726121.1 hypothetical protein [Chloroflexota bacterium]
MPADFEWHTEEGWTDEPARTKPERTARPRRRRWITALLAIYTLALAIATTYWLANRQVAASVNLIEEDVRLTHELVMEAAGQGDVDLFAAYLSGRDARWSNQQRALVSQHLFGNLDSLDLHKADTAPRIEQITVSPDLRRAEVHFTQVYTTHLGHGLTETVTLSQTAIYRRGNDRWLFAPPEADFWGEATISRDQHLTLYYPQRDAAVARRLATDLEAQLSEMCASLAGLNCPATLRVEVFLDTDPESLLLLADAEAMLASGRDITLPTPGLVGQPAGEAAYQALFRGYATYVVAAAITELVGYECCEQGLFYRALLDKQLSQLGLRPWPLTPAGYERLLATSNGPHSITTSYWQNRAAQAPTTTLDWERVYALVDFVWEEAGAAANLAEMQRQLGRLEYDAWLQRFVDADHLSRSFALRWTAFLYHHSLSGQSAGPPIPLPDQEVIITCNARLDEPRGFYRLDVRAETWELVARENTEGMSGSLSTIPTARGIILDESQRGYTRITWQREEQEIILHASSDSAGVFSWVTALAPSGRYVVVGMWSLVGEQPTNEYQIFDLDHCTPADCASQAIPGRPVWSPDGAGTLLLVSPAVPAIKDLFWQWRLPIYRGNARGELVKEVGSGNNGFWLDDETYGYIHLAEGPELEVVTASVDDDRPHVILRSSELLEVLPPEERPEQLLIGYVLINPANLNDWLVVADSDGEAQPAGRYYFLFNNQEAPGKEALSLIYQSGGNVFVEFAPNGRWLTIYNYYSLDSHGGEVALLDWQTGQIETIGTFSMAASWPGAWSADGQWYVLMQRDYLTLVAPAYNYQRLFFQDLGYCHQVTWSVEE